MKQNAWLLEVIPPDNFVINQILNYQIYHIFLNVYKSCARCHTITMKMVFFIEIKLNSFKFKMADTIWISFKC